MNVTQLQNYACVFSPFIVSKVFSKCEITALKTMTRNSRIHILKIRN